MGRGRGRARRRGRAIVRTIVRTIVKSQDQEAARLSWCQPANAPPTL